MKTFQTRQEQIDSRFKTVQRDRAREEKIFAHNRARNGLVSAAERAKKLQDNVADLIPPQGYFYLGCASRLRPIYGNGDN